VAPNRKRLGISAPEHRWKVLGELLEEWRRVEHGHRSRRAFAEARLPRTAEGNPNVRLVTDIENNLRPNHWPAGTLRELARAYQVTYNSIGAVLRGEADRLSPAEAALPPATAVPGTDSRRTPPVTGEDNSAATWPHAETIWQRLHELADSPDPTGAELFGEGTDDARTWDDPRLRQLLSIRERIWNIADLRRRESGTQWQSP
jgi:hypothetical protein